MRGSRSNGASWDDRFQEAALDPGRWLPVLQELADATGSSRAELVGFNADRPTFNWVTSIDARTLADFHRINAGSSAISFRIAADTGTAPLDVVHEVHYDQARRALIRDDYLDFCEEYHMTFGCQTALIRAHGALVGLSILRSRSEGRTTQRERRTFAAAARSAQAAVRLQRAIEEQGFHLLAGTLEAMSLSCLLLDRTGSVRLMTPSAARLIAEHPLLHLADHRLSSNDARTRRGIDVALRAVLGPEAAAHVRLPLYEQAPVPMIVLDLFRLPVRDWTMHFAPSAILVLRDGRVGTRGGAQALIDAFGLTPAEAQIALSLSAGLSRQKVAASRGVSLETLRAQVKSLYLKTGCRRESELVLLVKALLD